MPKAKDSKEKSSDGTLTLKACIEICHCGGETFYISKARDVYCSECRKKIPNTTVFTSSYSTSGTDMLQ